MAAEEGNVGLERNRDGIARGRVWARLLLVACLGTTCSAAEIERTQREEKADFHHKLANGYFHNANVDLAIRELVTALGYSDSHPDSRYLYGFILFGRKRYEEASEHFRRALVARPLFFAARNHLGVTYLELERWYDAIVTLEPLLKEPTYTTQYLVYNNLGWAYFKQGDLRQADKHLRMAVFLNPKFCNAWRNLGLLALAQRDTRGAVEHFTEAVGRCPTYAELHLQRGEALDADRRQSDADAAFRRCAELAGDTAVGRRCRSRVSSSAGTSGWNDAALHP
ncbi:MAG: tetratricopeptide repeat protein [Myxococcales bacterium]|nr:tetratricopeptide repeat protein [Myxococcales bacterium]